ncbi:MAG: hypothetical protein IPM77_15090 [Crocinitomicaceae bacterium]|nr:hypothetical protein [Crocinitomicaceae bacterium]
MSLKVVLLSRTGYTDEPDWRDAWRGPQPELIDFTDSSIIYRNIYRPNDNSFKTYVEFESTDLKIIRQENFLDSLRDTTLTQISGQNTIWDTEFSESRVQLYKNDSIYFNNYNQIIPSTSTEQIAFKNGQLIIFLRPDGIYCYNNDKILYKQVFDSRNREVELTNHCSSNSDYAIFI